MPFDLTSGQIFKLAFREKRHMMRCIPDARNTTVLIIFLYVQFISPKAICEDDDITKK